MDNKIDRNKADTEGRMDKIEYTSKSERDRIAKEGKSERDRIAEVGKAEQSRIERKAEFLHSSLQNEINLTEARLEGKITGLDKKIAVGLSAQELKFMKELRTVNLRIDGLDKFVREGFHSVHQTFSEKLHVMDKNISSLHIELSNQKSEFNVKLKDLELKFGNKAIQLQQSLMTVADSLRGYEMTLRDLIKDVEAVQKETSLSLREHSNKVESVLRNHDGEILGYVNQAKDGLHKVQLLQQEIQGDKLLLDSQTTNFLENFTQKAKNVIQTMEHERDRIKQENMAVGAAELGINATLETLGESNRRQEAILEQVKKESQENLRLIKEANDAIQKAKVEEQVDERHLNNLYARRRTLEHNQRVLDFRKEQERNRMQREQEKIYYMRRYA